MTATRVIDIEHVTRAAAAYGIDLPEGGVARVAVLTLDAWGELVTQEAAGRDVVPGDLDVVFLRQVISRSDAAGRATAFTRAREALRPGGVVVADYAALPGWRRLQPVRELLQLAWGNRHAVLRSAADAQPDGSVQQELLTLALERLRDVDAAPDEAVRRERELEHELATGHDPLSIRDIADIAHEAGLCYVGEVDEAHRAWQALPAADRIRELAGADPVAQQLFVDLAIGAAYKRSLFAAAG